MCGITGYFGKHAGDIPLKMTESIAHRGPDDSGWWTDCAAGIALGHRRLSILDLSPAGHQPMHSACGRYVLVFNGELYNHLEVRAELSALGAAPSWRGHSDTETLLAAISHWGIEAAIKRMAGMFAIALWDKEQRELTLIRDRLGEKPLYYGTSKGIFLFGSELKSIRAYPCFDAHVNRAALAAFLRHGYIPAPLSIYEGIRKLEPGCILTLKSPDDAPSIREYWSLSDVHREGQSRPFAGTDDEAVQELESKLSTAVRLQMLADVPLGAFLSGGIDSSTIVALMQAQSKRPVKTFTIGFNEENFNEAAHARKVALHLGTDHQEWYISPRDALEVIPSLAQIWDEPFADSSQIPTLLVARMARQQITVALSGDGGDELFWGYSRYARVSSDWDKVRRIPAPIKSLGAKAIRLLSPASWESIAGGITPKIAGAEWQGRTGDRLHKIADILAWGSRSYFYRESVSLFKNPSEIMSHPISEDALPAWASIESNFRSFMEEMAYRDCLSYLPDDILAKVDRAAMAVSLEGRIPLLDHRIVEYSFHLPAHMKVRDGKGKWLLRKVLYRHVPKELIERPKQGFGVPIDDWLRGPLREWAEELLCESKLKHQGYLNVAAVRKLWNDHLSGRRSSPLYLWNILMFQSWLQHWENDLIS